MKLFKKKKSIDTKTESCTGAGKTERAKTVSIEKATPACGFKWRGRIYDTMEAANEDYRKMKIRLLFPHRHIPGMYGGYCTGEIVEQYEALKEIMESKLEVE